MALTSVLVSVGLMTGSAAVAAADGLHSPASGGRVGGPAAQSPSVAVAPHGTAYLAFNDTRGVALCAIPRGTARCRPHPVIDDGVNDFLAPPLLGAGAGGGVDLVSAADPAGAIMLLRSQDRGAHVRRVATLGHGEFFGGAFGPRGRVLLTDDQDGLTTLVARPGSPTSRFTQRDGAVAPGSSAAGWIGDVPVVTADTPHGGVSWALTGDGSPARGRDWTRRRLAADQLDAMAGGRRGLFLLQVETARDRRDALVVWRWRGDRFRPAARLPASGPATGIGGVALAQTARGALLAAWYDSADAAIFAEVSIDGGRHWSAPRELVSEVAPVDRMSVAVGRSGGGVIAYDSQRGGVWVDPVSVGAIRR